VAFVKSASMLPAQLENDPA